MLLPAQRRGGDRRVGDPRAIIPGLVEWWNASSGPTTDLAGSTPVVNTGDSVGAWKGLVAGTVVPAQGLGNRDTWVTNKFGSRPAVAFSGSNNGLIGTLNHALQGVSDQGSLALDLGELTHEPQRGVAEVHMLARFDGKLGNLFGGDFRHEFGDPTCDRLPALIEGILPKQAGHQRALQFSFWIYPLRDGAFMGVDRARGYGNVSSHHVTSFSAGGNIRLRSSLSGFVFRTK